MRRRCKGIVFVSGMTILLLIASVSFAIQNSSVLEWGVEIGDEYNFEVFCERHSSLNHYHNSLTALNNSTIKVRIISLPEIGVIWHGKQFIDEIVNSIKTECTFENGTELLLNQSVPLNAIISLLILPIGNWQYLDSLFPDSSANDDIGNYVAFSNDSIFYFGSDISDYEMDNGWYGHVNKTTGMLMYYHSSYIHEWYYPIPDIVNTTTTIRLIR